MGKLREERYEKKTIFVDSIFIKIFILKPFRPVCLRLEHSAQKLSLLLRLGLTSSSGAVFLLRSFMTLINCDCSALCALFLLLA